MSGITGLIVEERKRQLSFNGRKMIECMVKGLSGNLMANPSIKSLSSRSNKKIFLGSNIYSSNHITD